MPKELQRRNSPEEIIERVHKRALLLAEEALKEGEIGDRPWSEVSTRVKIGVMLASKAMDKHQEDVGAKREFGLLVLQGKIKDPRAWETFAAAADKPAVDVEAVPVPKIEGKQGKK